MSRFEGIITPIVTPFNRDREQTINYAATEKLMDHLIEKGISGIFALGSNGEFHVISGSEKIEFVKKVVEIADHRVPVYAGTGTCSTQETICLSQKMENLGVDAVSIITPYFIKLSDRELIEHYTRIAKSIHIPIILYNIPQSTGHNLSKEVVKELAQIPNIMGIKDSSGDMENLKGYLESVAGTNMEVLVGSDSMIAAAIRLGAAGAVAGTSNLIPEVAVSLYKALLANDGAAAEKLQKKIEPLRTVLHMGTVPVMLKRSVELSGIPVGPARFPAIETGRREDEKIREMLNFYGLLN